MENPYKFTCREYDEEIGLYYYRARHYSPFLMRFLQKDPEGMVDGTNMYAYCENNPINNVDPDGTVWCYGVAWYNADKARKKYRGKDKWQHAFVGCTLRQAFCSYQKTWQIANMKELSDKYFGGTVSRWDIYATMMGWIWGMKQYMGWCRIGWWRFLCRKTYSCSQIMNSHRGYLNWLQGK